MSRLAIIARSALVNSLLVLASLAACYVAMEYAVFRLLLPVAAPDIRSRVPEMADVLTQATKSAYLPHDYVALLGDSYAEGLGDWLSQNGSKRNGPFHSADIIRQLTGRDVVSFGVRNAGSAEAMVQRPAEAFPSSRCSLFPVIEPPQQMFVYFYEGNDIEDNFRFMDRVSARYGRADAGTMDRYLTEDYAASSLLRCHGQFGEMTFKLAEFLSQYYITGYFVPQCGTPIAAKNHLVVGNRIVETIAMQGPAPHYSDDSIARAMSVFARSLAWLRQRFPAIPITMVYVPSPLAIYHHAADTVAFCSTTGGGAVASGIISRHHELMRDMVARMSAEQKVDFLDATPALRRAAATAVLHGPHDTDHLNREGYEVLGKFVAAHVQDAPAD